MKLVIATPLYPPEIGGPATYAKILVEELPKHGIEVELVKFSDVRHLPKLIRHIVYYWRVLKAARNADVVLALDPVSVGLPAMRAARKAGKKFVVKIVGDYAWEQGVQRCAVTDTLDEFVQTKQRSARVRTLQAVQAYVAHAAARVIVPSEYLKKIVVSWKIPGEKIEVIYNAVTLGEIGQVPFEVVALPKPLVVSVGRLVPWKGFSELIDAAKRAGTSLAIVGDGPEYSHLKRQLGDRIVLTGRLSHADTLAVIKSADTFVLNSLYEGLSHTLIEAAMLGVPILATNAGGNSEVVGNGVNGTLIPVGDSEALGCALTERATPVSRDTSRFSIEAMVSKTLDLLKSV